MRPYFLKAENNERGASEHHAVGGPLNVADERSPRRLTARFLAAAEAAGIPRIPDYNGPEQDGASPVQVTQRNGARFSAADAYLRPNMKRPNLDVITARDGARRRAVGRPSDGRAHPRPARAPRARRLAPTREVILSAGAIGSPQLLLLSGIGPADQLRSVGVAVNHDLPGVGENLHDHPYVVVHLGVDGAGVAVRRRQAQADWPSGCCAAAGR